MIEVAHNIGVDAVKFQKRNPEECVPMNKRDEMRKTPWGNLKYIDYRYRVELEQNDYEEINSYCNNLGIDWFASVWDLSSIDFILKLNPLAIKVPSDKLNDITYLEKLKNMNCPLILSTGGSDYEIIDLAVKTVGNNNNALLQCTSIYPCEDDSLNLRVVESLYDKYNMVVGFSSHHTSPIYGALSVAHGARIVEQHFTLNRAMWGSDQAMSLEPRGLELLVKYIRGYESARGDGVKKVFENEKSTLKRTKGR